MLCGPLTQNNGYTIKLRSSSGHDAVNPKPTSGETFRTATPWVCTTPFGSALLPDVQITNSWSAGNTSASNAVNRSSSTPAASGAS